MVDAKEEFCKLARASIVDEEEARKEYNQMLNSLYDWQESESDEATKISISRMITDITAVRNQESQHAVLFARIIDNHCRGLGK